jgi:plasmid stabilization system protein ParE
MVTKIIWRKKALRYIKETAIYLESEFSLKTANSFVDSVMKTIEKVSKYPVSYRKAPKTKTVHFTNIDKHRQMFFRESGNILIISAFFDTRQDPRKRPF